jgi:hypothetical protein
LLLLVNPLYPASYLGIVQLVDIQMWITFYNHFVYRAARCLVLFSHRLPWTFDKCFLSIIRPDAVGFSVRFLSKTVPVYSDFSRHFSVTSRRSASIWSWFTGRQLSCRQPVKTAILVEQFSVKLWNNRINSTQTLDWSRGLLGCDAV